MGSVATDGGDPRRERGRHPVADVVGAVGALIVLATALTGWAATSGGINGNGDLRPPSGLVRSVQAFTPVPLVLALVPIWSYGRRVRGRRPLPGWMLVMVGAVILLVLSAGGVHMVSQAVGHRPPEVYAVPRGAVAIAALGASAIIGAGLAGIFAASRAVGRQRD